METAMSDLFDEYPMLMFALEALVALSLLVFIVVWTSSGKKKAARQLDDRARRSESSRAGSASRTSAETQASTDADAAPSQPRQP
jgi:hypothetical protein